MSDSSRQRMTAEEIEFVMKTTEPYAKTLAKLITTLALGIPHDSSHTTKKEGD